MNISWRLILPSQILMLIVLQTAFCQNQKLVICGGGSVPNKAIEKFRELAGPQPRLVIIPTASRRKIVLDDLKQLWSERGFQDLSVLHTNDRDVASTTEFVQPLKDASAVWISGGSQQRVADAYLDTLVEQELHKLLHRGGVIGGTSAGAAIQSRIMIARGDRTPVLSTGFDLLPGAIVDQHFLWRNRISRLTAAVRKHPALVGFGIDESTALIANEGKLKVVGRSYVVRIEFVKGNMRIDTFHEGDSIPLPLVSKKMKDENKG